MGELLSKFDAGELIGLTAVAGGLLIGLACSVSAIIGGYWESVRRAEVNSRLTEDMLDRGVPTEEIVNVILAMGVDEPEEALLAQVRRRAEEVRAGAHPM